MPLDIPGSSADVIDTAPKFFEPLLPATDTDDWQETLRRIFATEGAIWQRRVVARPPVSLRG
jgi:hypothetical protein